MKSVLSFVTVSLFTAVAFAWPQLGDATVYDVQMTSGAQSATGTLALQTTAINAAQDSLTVHEIVVIGGQQREQDQSVKLSEVQQAAQVVPYLIAHCVEQKGTLEDVLTPAGTFHTCKLANDNNDQTGFTWYADVIFGWAKQVTTQKSNGQVNQLILKSVTPGK